MSGRPFLSVLVPALNGRQVLPRCFEALAASDLPRGEWELIVIDDGSTDGTQAYAAGVADRVVEVADGPRGPGYARNRGAEVARGEVLVFIDADVCVHPDTLRRFAELFRAHPDVAGAFGAYDAEPEIPGFLSQYRNLYHRYVHLQGAGDAETFWAGCGAIRRDAFLQVGGYDAARYPRPQIEDIDLGYRLGDAGHRLVLDPAIQAKHLKRWTLANIVRTDVVDRGVPWMRLLLERARGRDTAETLNVNTVEKVKTALVGVACLCTVLALALADARWLGGAVAALLPVVLANGPLFAWFARLRGWGFAARVVPMNLLYYFLSGFAVVLAYGGRLSSGGAERVLPPPLASRADADEAAP